MNVSVLALIEKNFPKMSKSQRRIAQYIKENCINAAFMTATKLAQAAGVSESTVIRFAAELGFDGYPDLQEAVRATVKRKLTSVQRIKLGDERISGDILGTVIANDTENLRQTLAEVDRTAFNAAVDGIVKASHVYIIGVRSSSALASFLYFYFDVILENVTLVRASSGEEVFEELLRLGENDAVLGISFPRYSKRTVDAMDFAKKRKATVIALTDSMESPVAENADCVLIAKNDMASVVDSLVAPLSMINALIVGVCQEKKEDAARAYSLLEGIWDEYNTYDKRI